MKLPLQNKDMYETGWGEKEGGTLSLYPHSIVSCLALKDTDVGGSRWRQNVLHFQCIRLFRRSMPLALLVKQINTDVGERKWKSQMSVLSV